LALKYTEPEISESMNKHSAGTQAVALRDLARADIPAINAWRQDRFVTDPLGAPPRHISLDVDLAWFDEYLRRRGTDVRCVICVGSDAAPVGIVSLTSIHPVHRSAEFHVMIGKRDLYGQGIGTSATRQMLRHGFLDLNVRRIYLSVLAGNTAAVRVYEKAGFRQEGVAKEAAYKNGEYEDVLLMALLRAEFASL
jgi:RimJ/RimL family protein N-acetyltransferase